MTPIAENRRWVLGIAEVLLSGLTVATAVLFPLLALGTQLCAYAVCSEPTADDVRDYNVLLAVAATSVVATFVVAVRRGAQRSWVWHGVVTVATLTSAVVFSFSAADSDRGPGQTPVNQLPVSTPSDGPSDRPSYVPCYSGGSNDCPGG